MRNSEVEFTIDVQIKPVIKYNAITKQYSAYVNLKPGYIMYGSDKAEVIRKLNEVIIERIAIGLNQIFENNRNAFI